jgi:hypothetical protein
MGIKISKESHIKHMENFAKFCLTRPDSPIVEVYRDEDNCAVRLILSDGGELTCTSGMVALSYKTEPYGAQWALFAEKPKKGRRSYEYVKVSPNPSQD